MHTYVGIFMVVGDHRLPFPRTPVRGGEGDDTVEGTGHQKPLDYPAVSCVNQGERAGADAISASGI